MSRDWNFIDGHKLAMDLRITRHSRQLSMRHVARNTGISVATISRVEREDSRPDPKTLHELCKWMNKPVSDYVQTTHPIVTNKDVGKICLPDGNRRIAGYYHKCGCYVFIFRTLKAFFTCQSHEQKFENLLTKQEQ